MGHLAAGFTIVFLDQKDLGRWGTDKNYCSMFGNRQPVLEVAVDRLCFEFDIDPV